MPEIYIATEFTHPAERVWRALTDPALLTHWLAGTEINPLTGSSFQIRLVDLPGLDAPIDGEVVEVDPPHTLVMRWRQEQWQTQVSAELAPSPDGCQLTFRERLEIGDWEPEQQELREQSYQRIFTVQLPAALDWIAFREQNFRGDATAELPPVVDRSRTRRRTLWFAAAMAGILLGGAGILAVVLFWSTGTAPSDPTAADGLPSGGVAVPTATVSPGKSVGARPTTKSPKPTPTTTLSAGPSQKPSIQAASAAATKARSEPDRPSLDAEYQTVESGLFDYTGKVVLHNTGKTAVADWVVTVTLSGTVTLDPGSGVAFEQKGRTVTFTGGPVAANGSASFRFDVNVGLLPDRKPDGCTVGGSPCAGL